MKERDYAPPACLKWFGPNMGIKRDQSKFIGRLNYAEPSDKSETLTQTISIYEQVVKCIILDWLVEIQQRDNEMTLYELSQVKVKIQWKDNEDCDFLQTAHWNQPGTQMEKVADRVCGDIYRFARYWQQKGIFKIVLVNEHQYDPEYKMDTATAANDDFLLPRLVKIKVKYDYPKGPEFSQAEAMRYGALEESQSADHVSITKAKELSREYFQEHIANVDFKKPLSFFDISKEADLAPNLEFIKGQFANEIAVHVQDFTAALFNFDYAPKKLADLQALDANDFWKATEHYFRFDATPRMRELVAICPNLPNLCFQMVVIATFFHASKMNDPHVHYAEGEI